MENVLVLVLVGAGLLARWLIQNASAASKKTPGAPVPPPPSRSAPPERTATPAGPVFESAETERVRKFLEALGRPPTATPPPKVKPRPTAPVRREWQPIPPLVAGKAPKLPPPPPPPIAPAPTPELVTPTVELASPAGLQKVAGDAGFAVRDLGADAAARAATPEPSAGASAKCADDAVASLRWLLRSPAGLRQAVMLREIFGRPRSLQPLDYGESV